MIIESSSYLAWKRASVEITLLPIRALSLVLSDQSRVLFRYFFEMFSRKTSARQIGSKSIDIPLFLTDWRWHLKIRVWLLFIFTVYVAILRLKFMSIDFRWDPPNRRAGPENRSRCRQAKYTNSRRMG